MIAVCGIGAVLPGAATPLRFWERCIQGASALAPPTDDTLQSAAYGDPRSPDAVPTTVGGWLRGQWTLDWRKYRIPPADLQQVNPLQFAVLDAGTQAVSRMRVVPRQRTAIVLGASGLGCQPDSGLRIRLDDMVEALETSAAFSSIDEGTRQAVATAAVRCLEQRLQESSSDNTVGSLASVAAARIAMHLDLYGPHYAIDADHASAFEALGVAIQGLFCREWDCVLTGAVSELLGPLELLAYHRMGLLSPTGAVRPWSSEGDGTVLGEGAVMFALKRLEDAVSDGENVLAVIRGTAVAGGGQTPPAAAEVATLEEAIASALDRAGVGVDHIGLLSCEGTGVAAWDRNEVDAMHRTFGSAATPPVVSMGKPIVGHLRAASGAVSLLQAVLALAQRQLPPLRSTLATTLPVLEEPQPWDARARWALVGGMALDGRCHQVVLEGFEATARRSVRSARSDHTPAAILGMSGIYAGAGDLDRFWTNLVEGRDQVVDVPEARWSLQRYWSPDRHRRERSYARMGSFIDLPTPAAGDPFPDAAWTQIDPSHLVLLRTAQQAIDEAGGERLLDAVGRDRVGVFTAFMPFQGRKWLAEARVNYSEFASALDDALQRHAIPEPTRAAIGEEAREAFVRRSALPTVDEHSLPGWSASMGASRVAEHLDVSGPRFAVESACASTLAAVHAAVLALRTGACDLALVGAAWCEIVPEFYVATSRFHGLSPAGIAPFDARAAGFVPGEGGGTIVLARLEDAHRLDRPVRAVIRGIGGSSDGRGRSVLQPNVEGEALAVQRALAMAGIEPDEVAYVECHGTGTVLGDATEGMALACSYGGSDRREPLNIGTVKSNLGHLVPAAGMPAITKVVLAMQHDLIPASLHCEQPTHRIAFEEARLQVVTRALPWPREARSRRCAGVSAFGIGGTNFHVLIDDAVEAVPTGRECGPVARASSDHDERDRAASLFAFVGDDHEACVRAAQDMAAVLDGATSEDLAEAALASRTKARESSFARPTAARVALTVNTSAELLRRTAQLTNAADDPGRLAALAAGGAFLSPAEHRGAPGPVVVMFPGQGSHYAGMARELAMAHPIVREVADRADDVWRSRCGEPLGVLTRPVNGTSHPFTADELHAAVFVVNIAVHEVLLSYGIRADVYVGQSAGEISALVAAGALSFEDGLRAISARTDAVLRLPLPDPGRLAMVSCGAPQLEQMCASLAGLAVVAADNCPTAALAAGETDAMSQLQRDCEAAGIDYVDLDVSHAYHSPLIAAAAPAYRRTLEQLDWRIPRQRVLSTVDLEDYDTAEGAIDRLVLQYTTRVRFREAVEKLWSAGARVFVESGPKWPLCGYVSSTLGARPHVAQAAIHPKLGEHAQLMRLVGCAFAHGFGELEPTSTTSSVRDATERAPKSGAQARSSRSPQSPTATSVLRALVEAMVERTGYPEDMLDPDLDLEADLGIDTVKQVEVFGRVREHLGLPVDPSIRLRELNTLRKVATSLVERCARAPVDPPPTPPPEPIAQTAPNALEPGDSPKLERVLAVLIPAIAERTGYPPDMLDLDLDLEADLGIDTVKQVEVFARVRERLGVPHDPSLRLRDLNTLRKIAERMAHGGRSDGSQRVATPAPVIQVPLREAPRLISTPASAEYPLLQSVTRSSPARLQCRRVFNMADDRYLADYDVAGRRCVPSTMGWEMLAEAASRLLADLPIRAALDLTAMQPLWLDAQGTTEVLVDAEILEEGRVRAQLAVASAHGDPVTTHAGVFTTSASDVTIPRRVRRAFDRRQRRNAAELQSIAPAQLGETMGGCVWARSLSFSELVGGIRTDHTDLMEGSEPLRFALAPLALECSLMLAGFAWYAFSGRIGTTHTIERLDMVRAPAEDEELWCHVRLRNASAASVIADLVVLGHARDPVFAITGLTIADSDGDDHGDVASWSRFYRSLRTGAS